MQNMFMGFGVGWVAVALLAAAESCKVPEETDAAGSQSMLHQHLHCLLHHDQHQYL